MMKMLYLCLWMLLLLSLVPRPHPACISLPVYNARAILKAIRTGVGFGSGTETNCYYDTVMSF